MNHHQPTNAVLSAQAELSLPVSILGSERLGHRFRYDQYLTVVEQPVKLIGEPPEVVCSAST